ncbi:hypothetical protein CN645_18505 [Burkholderia sp. IDO3]|nr:hypothetical protein CN645_18505 [Burkholderia sp. IDO3]
MRARAGAASGRRRGQGSDGRVGIHHVDRSQGSVMSDSSFRPFSGRPSGLRRTIPAIRQMTCRAAFGATIPA